MNNKIYSQSMYFIRIAALAIMLAITFTGIANAQRTGKTHQGLTVKKVRLWTENNNVVPVCWETSGYDREKDIVEAAVQNTWAKYSNITFDGWGMCSFGGISGSATAKSVRIRISPQNAANAGASGSSRYGMDALSSANDKNPGINFSFNPDGTAIKGRVEYVAVHEFGHVLGFVHEQDTPGNAAGPARCPSGGIEPNATQLTNYDPDSVMNYCNKYGNMQGILTDKDIAGLQIIYGQPGQAKNQVAQAKNQGAWRFCDKCFTLFYDGFANKGACPLGGGHHASGFNFFLRYDAVETSNDQSAWRYCDKCHEMFYDGFANKGACPLGGGHHASGFNFTLQHDVAATAKSQASWRYCSKCHAIFYNGFPTKGSCPAGGSHTAQGYSFVLPWS